MSSVTGVTAGTPLRFLSVGGNDNGGGGTAAAAAKGDSAEAKRAGRTTTTTNEGDSTTTSTRKPRPTSSTASTAPGPSTTQATGPTTTSATAPDCRPNELHYATTVDRSSYGPNATVNISMVVRNTGTRPCTAPNACGIGPWGSVSSNFSNQVVFKNNPIAVACTNPPPAGARLAVGADHNYGVVASWDQMCNGGDCNGKHAPAGSYFAQAHRAGVDADPINFSLTG